MFMGRLFDWLFNSDHPWRAAFVSFAFGMLQVFEALHIDNPNGLMYPFSWVCAGIFAFMSVLFLVIGISEHFSRD
jgi:hypothetical protein